MVYAPEDFVDSYMRRTLQLIRGYRGPHQATNLINSLLGLLVVPGDAFVARIPEAPLSTLKGWGVSRRSVRRLGRTGHNGHGRAATLRSLYIGLRRSMAHLGLRILHKGGRITGFEFRDKSGFHAVIAPKEMRKFIVKLTECVETYGGLGPDTEFIASWAREPFHKPDCTWARRIRGKNLLGVKTRHAAIRAGHRPCKVCNP
jgi:hypothetical protein